MRSNVPLFKISIWRAAVHDLQFLGLEEIGRVRLMAGRYGFGELFRRCHRYSTNELRIGWLESAGTAASLEVKNSRAFSNIHL